MFAELILWACVWSNGQMFRISFKVYFVWSSVCLCTSFEYTVMCLSWILIFATKYAYKNSFSFWCKKKRKKNLPLARDTRISVYLFILLDASFICLLENIHIQYCGCDCVCICCELCEQKTHRFSNEMKENDTVLFALERLL